MYRLLALASTLLMTSCTGHYSCYWEVEGGMERDLEGRKAEMQHEKEILKLVKELGLADEYKGPHYY